MLKVKIRLVMALPDTGLGELVDNEDYYSLLNASRESSQEELKSCYRRLCMVYHPDKQDHSHHKDASEIFGRIQTAYSVLSDPSKRHIYDVYGKKGLEADWQVVERRQTPQEMREEYERIQRLRAQHRLDERTHPKGMFTMTVNATSLFDDGYSDEDDEYYEDRFLVPDITRISLTQSIEAPLTGSNTATISSRLESKNGNGRGNLNVGLKTALSTKSWGEVEVELTDTKQINFVLKGYRNLAKGLFALVTIPVQTYVDNDYFMIQQPGANLTVGHVLGKDLFGSLDLSVGGASSLSTNLVKETPNFRLTGKLQMGFPHSFGLCSFTYKLPDDDGNIKLALKAGTFGCMFEYGAEHKVSQYSTISAHVNVGIPLGVSVKLRLNRASQTYLIPIVLSDEVNFTAAFYGTVVPVVLYVALQTLIINPYKRRERERESEENEHSLSDETNKRRKEAAAMVNMMKESTERKIEIEERRMGLVITEACYGCFVTENRSNLSSKLVDVTIPLQNLVENSSLQLPVDITKSGLPGFYDPCPGRDKQLKVQYKFRGGLHQVTIDDKDVLRIPLRSHAVTTEH